MPNVGDFIKGMTLLTRITLLYAPYVKYLNLDIFLHINKLKWYLRNSLSWSDASEKKISGITMEVLENTADSLEDMTGS